MKTIQIQPENTFRINYVIYERSDLFVLLKGVFRKKGKDYFSNIPIKCDLFFSLLGKLNPHSDIIDVFSEQLFNSVEPIIEIEPKAIINKELFIELNTLINPLKAYKKSA